MPITDFRKFRNEEGPISVNTVKYPIVVLGIKEDWLPEGSRLRKERTPYIELLPEKEIVKSFNKSLDAVEMYRSASVDIGSLRRNEKYLSRWSRENTPVDSEATYKRYVRRSFTPVRDVSGYKVVNDERRPVTTYRARTPVGMVTTPYHTNVNYYSESQPIRKYDVFQLRTWSYPIYNESPLKPSALITTKKSKKRKKKNVKKKKKTTKQDFRYMYGRDHDYNRPYSYTRRYATTSNYTPPKMSADCRNLTSRSSYSGYNYVASETNYNIATKPWSISNYRFWRSHVSSSPWYWSHYGVGRNGTRHYNSYRPPAFTSRLSTYWPPYY